jgi:pimeloyl-ACP methyl ester carboxylesterase
MDWPIQNIALPGGLRTRLVDSGGHGTPLILVHGLAASLEIWNRVAPGLARTRRVIAFDLPGFGEADKPDAAYDAPFFIRRLADVLDFLGVQRADFAGSSLGASLLVRFAAAYPERAGRLILAAPGGFGRQTHPFLQVPTLPIIGYALGRPMWLTTAFAVWLAMHDPKAATRELVSLADRCSKSPGGHRAFVRTLKAVIGPLGVRDRAAFEADARAVRAPVLLLWGEQDRLFPIRQIERAQALLAGSAALRIDACGHYPQWEAADRFIGEAEKFLS